MAGGVGLRAFAEQRVEGGARGVTHARARVHRLDVRTGGAVVAGEVEQPSGHRRRVRLEPSGAHGPQEVDVRLVCANVCVREGVRESGTSECK